MSGDVSRRRVLAALAAAGAGGALTGNTTAAALTDREGTGGVLTAGALDIDIAYEILTGPEAGTTGTTNGVRLPLPLGTLTDTVSSGATRITVGVPDQPDAVANPAAVWLATDCPPEATTLAEALSVTVSYAETGEVVASGSLREVADDLRGGVRLDGEPTSAGDDCVADALDLLFEYELTDYVGTASTDLVVEFAARQCRYDDGTNPFAGRSAEPCATTPEPCVCCRYLGKLNLEDDGRAGIGESFIAPGGPYYFDEGDSRYGIVVTDTTTKDNGTETTGVAFRLVERNGAPTERLCRVEVKGGRNTLRYEGTGSDTTALDGADGDGIIVAPDGKAISNIQVYVCDDASACADDVSSSDTNDTSGDDDHDGDNNNNGRGPGRGGGRGRDKKNDDTKDKRGGWK
ncbi:hypothetical protein [Halosegnis longus]|uniref:hypothetical protein n=1 Tax=Halosegnis longus TaxID=2216012 RepID=UPI00096A4696|nr:hypothetical protein [Salella cibi]